MTDLPRWQSHKQVHADKIVAAEHLSSSRAWCWHLRSGLIITPSDDLAKRMHVGPGNDLGYYVRYDDGYESWSPSKAFEEGYSPIAERKPRAHRDRQADKPRHRY